LRAHDVGLSMTINGPAPMILAMFMNTAVDQRVERWLREQGRWEAAERRIAELHRDRSGRATRASCRRGTTGRG